MVPSTVGSSPKCTTNWLIYLFKNQQCHYILITMAFLFGILFATSILKSSFISQYGPSEHNGTGATEVNTSNKLNVPVSHFSSAQLNKSLCNPDSTEKPMLRSSTYGIVKITIGWNFARLECVLRAIWTSTTRGILASGC